LYRTWRPKSFDDLVGQDAVVRTLRTALTSGKLAHAYLFSGPRGSGKTSAAKILARCIDCVLGPTPDPDNTCENCRAMLAGTALDVVEVDAASNRGIEEIRALRDSVKFAPASMRSKVYIIDEAHMLTREGANAFLKTLEEPPAHAVFILATTAPEALPPTILSRCQRYAFRRIPVAVMIERMREIAAAEGIAIDDGALGAIAYRADGGLRDALTMLEQVASYAGGPVDAAAVDAAFGATGRHYARALVDAILRSDAGAALRIVDEASDAGADMLGLIRGTSGEYRNLLVARIDPELLSRDLSAGDAEAATALAAATPQAKIVRALRLLAEALAAGRASGNPRLELETALLRLIVQHEDPSLSALATRVALLEQGAGVAAPGPQPAQPPQGAPVPRPGPSTRPEPPERAARTEPPRRAQPETENPETRKPATHAERTSLQERTARATSDGERPQPEQGEREVTTVRETDGGVSASAPAPPAAPTMLQILSLWDQVKRRVGERHKPLLGPLSQATPESLDGNTLTIGLTESIHESLLRQRHEVLESALTDVLRAPIRVLIKTKTPGSPVRAASSAHRAAPEASAATAGGEVDLLAYARKKLGGTETT
jgi:DNA polymerase-3 subunit gamma/tau